MKKSTRKLIPALAMLLISAVLMSTASFAWFSMNKEVYVDDMTVTAEVDSTFLVISNAANQTNNKATDADATNKTASLYPAAYGGISEGTITWNTAHSTSTSDHDAGAVLKPITANLENYILSNTFYVRTATGTNDASNLKVSDVDVTGTSVFTNAVSVVVKVGNNVNTYIDGTLVNTTPLADSVTSGADTVVEVYVYINGANEAVTTDNANLENALTGIAVKVTFTVA